LAESDDGKVTVYCEKCDRAVPATVMGDYYLIDCGHQKLRQGGG
jgi:hypothetical protein